MKRTVVLFVLLALALSVCSAFAETLTVNVWDANQAPGIQQIADEWTAISGIDVKVEVVDWDNYWTLLSAGASGGTLPDVFWMHSNTVQMYMDYDLLLDLTNYVANDDAINLDDYYQGIVDLYTRDSDGNVYALPKDHDTIALLYNSAIFDKYGVEYPTDNWTWEDMYEAAKQITEKSEGSVYGMAVNTSNNQDGWYNVVYDYGGNIVSDTHDSTALDSEGGKAGMEMVRKLLTVGAPQSVVAETGTDSLFQSDKVGMITQGSWMITSFYKAEHHDDYKWALLPYADVNGNGQAEPEERWSCYNGLGWAAAFNTPNPDAAYSLISWFCAKEQQIKQAELGITMAGMPGISDAFANAFPGMDITPFLEAENFSLYMRPYTKMTTVWEDPIQQAEGFLPAWQNPEDPALMEKACENAAAIIRDAIAQGY